MTFEELLCPSCALFFDFDGTLVDIAPRPEAVRIPEGLVGTLAAMHRHLGGAVAVISGRPIEQIDAFLAPLRLPAAGVHGAERRCADGSLALMEPVALLLVEQAAQGLAGQHPELLVERKRGSLALHYRQAPELGALCVAALRAAVDASPGLALLHGKMVVEAKPGGASKGRAIEAFMQEAPFAGRTPIFIGDDVTDEVGFAAVQRLGGLGVKVGEGASVANARMATPQDMREQMERAMAVKLAQAQGAR